MYPIFRYLDKRTRLVTILGALANGGVVLAQPLVLSQALSLDQGKLTYTKILHFAFYGFTVYFILYSLMLFCNHTHNVFRREIHMSIRMALFQRLIGNKDYSNDEKIVLLTQDMEFLGDNYLDKYVDLICWGFMALVTAFYIIAQDFLLGLIFVFFTILRPIPQFILNQRLKNTGDQMSKERTKVHSQVSDSMHGSQTLKVNHAWKENEKRVYQVNWDYQRAIQKFCFTHNIIFFCNGFMIFLSQVVPLVLGFYLAINGQRFSMASLVAMYIAAAQLVAPIQNIMYDLVEVQGAKSTADKIFHILDSSATSMQQDAVLSGVQTLYLSQLSKSFGSRRLFKDLNAEIRMGQKVLIKGASGSGKSTLFRMIMGEEICDEGKIEVLTSDGLLTSSFQGNIGLISQQPFLFNDTIRYNLALDQDFSDQELEEVLQRVGLDTELTDILNLVIQNNGENISGGQRVRIELARFLLREKDILLADEITAALDEENSRKVRQLLFSLPVMVLEIAHHIDDESQYDQIFDLNRI